jgi:hypothetical protein
MKLSLTTYRNGAVLSVILALAAQPGHAQFGGVVFDPTQSAHAIEQIQRNIQNSVTWQQQLANEIQMTATLDKDYQQAITTYNVIHGNLKTSAASPSGKRFSHSSRKRASPISTVRQLGCRQL